jgi:hypothetical protein
VATGAEIHAGPDPTTNTLATLHQKTRVCAGTDQQGFGYRLVQLTDGTAGFVDDSYVTDLAQPPPAPRSEARQERAAGLPPSPAKMAPVNCAPLVPAQARAGANVHAGPDTQTKILVTLRATTRVCVAAVSEGFGLRRVKLPDATDGFIEESSISE